jgi:hypothetical protein
MKQKIKRTVYFTNHQKMLRHIEAFAVARKITVSSAILGFIGVGLMVEGLPEGVEQLKRAAEQHREWRRRDEND